MIRCCQHPGDLVLLLVCSVRWERPRRPPLGSLQGSLQGPCEMPNAMLGAGSVRGTPAAAHPLDQRGTPPV